MADDRSNRGPQDRSKINLEEDYEVRYWSEELGVTPQKLRDAVQAVGSGVDAVRKHLSGTTA